MNFLKLKSDLQSLQLKKLRILKKQNANELRVDEAAIKNKHEYLIAQKSKVQLQVASV